MEIDDYFWYIVKKQMKKGIDAAQCSIHTVPYIAYTYILVKSWFVALSVRIISRQWLESDNGSGSCQRFCASMCKHIHVNTIR